MALPKLPKSLVLFGIVIAVGIIFQLVLIVLDVRETPVRTAEAFAKNFYYLDPAMQDQLCGSLSDSGEAVDEYLYRVAHDAGQRGFGTNYVRRMFTELHVETISLDKDSARLRVTGKTRTAINPVFMVIGKWFHLGEYHLVDFPLDLVKENGKWRVCGEVPGLTSQF